MIIYITIFITLIFALIFIKSKLFKSIFLYILFFILSFLTAIRDGIGTDFENYYYIYTAQWSIFSFEHLFQNTYKQEPLFVFLGVFTKTLGFSEPYFFFFLISIITFLIFNKAIKNFKFKWTIHFWFLYFCYFFLNFHFNTIRQGIMVSFVWLAFSYIQSKQIKKYITFIFIGSLFHSAAFIFLPFYWLLKINIDKKKLFWMALLALIAIITPFLFIIIDIALRILPTNSLFESLRFYAYIYYINVGVDSFKSITIGLIFNTTLLLIVFKNKTRLSNNIVGFEIYFNALTFAVFLSYIFSSIGVLVERISGVLFVSLLFLIPLLVIKISKNAAIRLFLYIVFIIYGLLILNANMYKKELDGNFQFIPYKSKLF